MRLLHTSDLHLHEDRPERLQALQEIMKVSEELKIDMLTIGGDLFDSEEAADALRPKLREIFSGRSFDTLVIPGNHDQLAYRRNLDFGSNLKVATGKPFETLSYEEWSIIAVPYTEKLASDLFSELLDVAEKTTKSLLILHCTLDIGYGSQDFGDEGVRTYFPVSSSTLSRLGFSYVLAGHFHTQLSLRDLGEGRMFVYPGSPVSLSWKEIGKRQIALIDTERGVIKGLPLNSFYRDMHDVKVKPGKEDDVPKEVSDWARERADKNCELKIIVSGHGVLDEMEFRKSLERVSRGANLEYGYRNVEEVLNHPLFRRFKEKLNSSTDIENKETTEMRVIETMSSLLAGRELRR